MRIRRLPALLPLTIAVATGIGVAAAAAQPETGSTRSAAEWITRANQALLPGDSMQARVQIVTHDGLGGTTLDEMDMIRVSEGGTSRTLIEVELPEAGAGTVYEIVARPGEPLERWVWLPELRRLRRIVGVRRTDPFLGTEFSYEDLGLALAEERRDSEVRLVGTPPGRIVELVSQPYHYYERVVTRIDASTHLPLMVLFYDRAGQLFRRQEFGAVRRFDGTPFPTTITVRDLLSGAYSVLRFESLAFDVEIPLERFTESAIRRRLAGAREVVPDPTPAQPGD